MFWKKKDSPTPLPVFPKEAPRPILKSNPDNSPSPSIRFATNISSDSPQSSQWTTASSGPSNPSRVILPRQPAVASTAPNPVVIRAVGPRRSSRPTSPATSSFGARVRTSSAPSTVPLQTPPMTSAAHITTPPTAYVSALQSRQPPPPSPYRPTTTADRRPLAQMDTLPVDYAPRPPRVSSLYETPSAPARNVPMLNIIPATPQDGGEEFNALPVAGTWRKRRTSQSSLEDSAIIKKESSMEELPNSVDTYTMPPQINSMPSIDVSLDFSPFEMSNQSEEDSFSSPPTDPLPPSPPSPPFQSYGSLPSLESHPSLPSSSSEESMPSSVSNSSLMSFPDVEEALGSMLASLSDGLPSEENLAAILQAKKQKAAIAAVATATQNPGLGLGLDLPEPASITAPLTLGNKKRPPPLDLFAARNIPAPTQQTAPPCINHRIAFYGTAKAHPNSPASGTFRNIYHTHTHQQSSTVEFFPSHYYVEPSSEVSSPPMYYRESFSRDSISLASEASDEDLHTASIISLTPIMGERGVMQIASEEVLGEEVGMAF